MMSIWDWGANTVHVTHKNCVAMTGDNILKVNTGSRLESVSGKGQTSAPECLMKRRCESRHLKHPERRGRLLDCPSCTNCKHAKVIYQPQKTLSCSTYNYTCSQNLHAHNKMREGRGEIERWGEEREWVKERGREREDRLNQRKRMR